MVGSNSDPVVVTGTGGYIGAAIAEHLLADGHAVLGLDRRPERESLRGREHFTAAMLDLADDDAVRAIAARVPCVRHVVHAAGGAHPGEVADGSAIPDADVERDSIRDNLGTAITVARHFRDPLAAGADRAGDACLMFVSSINAYGGYGLPVYSAAKAGLHGLAAALAPTLASNGMRTLVLVLGTVDHPGVRRLHADDPDHFDRILGAAPLRRLTSLSEVARSVAFGLETTALAGGEVVLDSGQLRASEPRW